MPICPAKARSAAGPCVMLMVSATATASRVFSSWIFWADQIVDIADDGDLDPRDRQIRTGVRQWIMSKVSRGYGERLVHSGDPESPVRVVHQQLLLADLTGEQLEALDRFTALIVEQQVVKPGS
jgi:hypothetical protein